MTNLEAAERAELRAWREIENAEVCETVQDAEDAHAVWRLAVMRVAELQSPLMAREAEAPYVSVWSVLRDAAAAN